MRPGQLRAAKCAALALAGFLGPPSAVPVARNACSGEQCAQGSVGAALRRGARCGILWPEVIQDMEGQTKDRIQRLMLSLTMLEAAALSLLRTVDHERDELRHIVEESR